MQVALERVGTGGRVVGIDLAPVAPLPAPNAAVLVGDMREPALAEAAATALGGPADVVLSDLSPKLSGVRDADIARSLDLVTAAVAVAGRLLRPGGAFVAKVFASPETDALVARLRPAFQALKIAEPAASRKTSTESYLVGKGFRPGRV
jgi:23S rRNA (uridine2552-2'-O)-methyltransferase